MSATINTIEPIAVTQTRAAKLLGITERTLRNWERCGLIAGKRVQGTKLYSYADLKKLAGVS